MDGAGAPAHDVPGLPPKRKSFPIGDEGAGGAAFHSAQTAWTRYFARTGKALTGAAQYKSEVAKYKGEVKKYGFGANITADVACPPAHDVPGLPPKRKSFPSYDGGDGGAAFHSAKAAWYFARTGNELTDAAQYQGEVKKYDREAKRARPDPARVARDARWAADDVRLAALESEAEAVRSRARFGWLAPRAAAWSVLRARVSCAHPLTRAVRAGVGGAVPC